MTNEVLTIAYADSSPTFPAGSAVASIVVSITDTSASPPVSVSQTVAPGTASITFPNVAVGDYTASAQAVDASGAALGSPATTTFTVSAPATISLSLPVTLSAAAA